MSHQRKIPFSLIGCFLGFIYNEQQQPKFLRLATLEGEWQIKLAKDLRTENYQGWMLGTQVHVWGYQKLKSEGFQLKAERLSLTAQPPASPLPPIAPTANPTPAISNSVVAKPPAQPKQAKAVIKVCQKSDCAKKGGKAICQTLDRMLADFGLEDRVVVQKTGCMKNCKAAPNLVVMPDKQHYGKIKANQVAAVIEKHFGNIASVDLPA